MTTWHASLVDKELATIDETTPIDMGALLHLQQQKPQQEQQQQQHGSTRKTFQQPTVGILCIDIATNLSEAFGKEFKSYIAASYVKYLESAGARVVPIWIGRDKHYYEYIMGKVNGVLIPGGAVYFDTEEAKKTNLSNACVRSSRYIYEIAEIKNIMGEYFPLWGTCLGMQLLTLHSTNGVDVRVDVNKRTNCALNLCLESDFRESKMFENLTAEMEKVLREEPFCYHYHRFGITKEALVNYAVDQHWHILATNKDSDGPEFATLIEHRKLPFYGCQFHPERVCYEQLALTDDACSHSTGSVEAARYFAKFFVLECMKSKNHFANNADELQHSIWNYEVKFTGRLKDGMHWIQCYLFDENSDYKLN